MKLNSGKLEQLNLAFAKFDELVYSSWIDLFEGKTQQKYDFVNLVKNHHEEIYLPEVRLINQSSLDMEINDVLSLEIDEQGEIFLFTKDGTSFQVDELNTEDIYQLILFINKLFN